MEEIEIDIDKETFGFLTLNAKSMLKDLCCEESMSVFTKPENLKELKMSIGEVIINELVVKAISKAIEDAEK